MQNKWPIWASIFVSFLGILNTGYLTIQHFRGLPPTCSVFQGCETVTNSVYSTLFGIPLALLGLIFYLVIFMLCLEYMRHGSAIVANLFWFGTVMGIIASTVLVCLQIFVIKALCQYCILSAIETILLFIFSSFTIKQSQSTQL